MLNEQKIIKYLYGNSYLLFPFGTLSYLLSLVLFYLLIEFGYKVRGKTND